MHFERLCESRPEDCKLPLIEEAEQEKALIRGDTNMGANDFEYEH